MVASRNVAFRVRVHGGGLAFWGLDLKVMVVQYFVGKKSYLIGCTSEIYVHMYIYNNTYPLSAASW